MVAHLACSAGVEERVRLSPNKIIQGIVIIVGDGSLCGTTFDTSHLWVCLHALANPADKLDRLPHHSNIKFVSIDAGVDPSLQHDIFALLAVRARCHFDADFATRHWVQDHGHDRVVVGIYIWDRGNLVAVIVRHQKQELDVWSPWSTRPILPCARSLFPGHKVWSNILQANKRRRLDHLTGQGSSAMTQIVIQYPGNLGWPELCVGGLAMKRGFEYNAQADVVGQILTNSR